MNKARFTKYARSELLGQTAYYETIEKGLGARFRAEVEAAAQRAAAFPLHGKPSAGGKAAAQRAAAFPPHGKPSAGGTRRRLVTAFPFSVVYTEEEYGVLIHAVADTRRLPEYWLSRLR